MVLGHALVLTLSLFGGLTFVEADLPGIGAWGNQLTGQVSTNFRHADFDGDGAADLLTARFVALQRDGAFPMETRMDFPLAQAEPTAEDAERPFCDVWGSELYLRHPDRLRVLRWVEGTWKERLNQPAEWPDEPTNEMTSDLQIASNQAAVRLERCLHDIDSDDTPEIIVSGQDGLHVYAFKNGAYARINILRVYPPLVTRPAREEQRLWPLEARRIQLPIRGMRCDIALNGVELSVIRREPSPGNEAGHVHISRTKLDCTNGFGLHSEQWGHETVELSRISRPFSLNGDGVVDYVGYEMGGGGMLGRALPIGGSFPWHETYASTDGGATFQSFRVQGFPVGAPFADFDADGDQDLITEPTEMFQGGIRETVSRMMTRHSFEHGVHVHLQDARGVFSKKPDIRGSFTIECEDALFRDEATLSRYHSGSLLNVTGDFDGDGYNDVVLRDQPNRLALYLNEGRRFSRRPAAVLTIRSEQRFNVTDVDGDRRSDIVIRWAEQSRGESELHNSVLLTRGDAP